MLLKRGEPMLDQLKLMSWRQMACDNVYGVLHLRTESNGTENTDVIELLDEDEDLCSTKVIQYWLHENLHTD